MISPNDLPLSLGNGLVLRFARPSDAQAVADFNAHIHSDHSPAPDELLRAWTFDLFSGDHPSVGPGDFTVVVDESAGGKIVSSLCTISQTWTYGGIPFGVGRPELVGTDPGYRKRGLIAAQMQVVHAISEARGEIAQAITGIPWYYRRFGYEMALDLGSRRRMFFARVPALKAGKQETLRMRPATVADIPLLDLMYKAFNASQLIARPRPEPMWRFEVTAPGQRSVYGRSFKIIETLHGEPVAYTAYLPSEHDPSLDVLEFAAMPGHSLAAAAFFLCRALKKEAEELSRMREQPLDRIMFMLIATHPAFSVLDELLGERESYAWYLRVPDLPRFLRHVAPVLESRLANSALAGHTGNLRLNFYTEQHLLVFESGALVDVATFEPTKLTDGDAFFPGLTFLQLLFGWRSLAELKHAFPDCSTNGPEAAGLVNALFPKSPSEPVALG